MLYTGGLINMKNNNALITVAMLSVLLQGDRFRDYLDIIAPFIKSEIPKVKGEKIDVTRIQSAIREKYGFEDLPVNVINKILERETKGQSPTVKKYKKEYFVNETYNDEKFLTKYKSVEGLVNRVSGEILKYLESNSNIKNLDINIAKELFIEFLETYGYTVANRVEDLKILTKKHRENYYIARFILAASEEQQGVFDDIIEIVKGFFVYKAIYIFNKEEKSTIESNLKGTSFYFDTKLLIFALGYNREEEKNATLELISLINKSGGKVKTFKVYRDEVIGILTKYAKDPRARASLSLNYFLENDYDGNNVMRIRDKLDDELDRIGIMIEDMPAYGAVDSDTIFDRRHLDLVELKAHLGEMLKYSNKKDNALEHDVLAIDAISRIREGCICRTIEDCRAIIITNNYGLVTEVLNLYRNNVLNGCINFLIGDLEVTSLLWLKTSNGDSSLPKLKLLEAAYAACEPTQELIEAFEQKVEMLKNEERLSDQDALMLRSQHLDRKELVVLSNNNPDEITDELIFTIKKTYDNQIAMDKSKAIDALENKLQSSRAKAINEAERKADAAANKVRRVWKGVSVALTILFVLLIIFLNKDSNIEKLFSMQTIALAIIAFFNGASAYDLITGKLKIANGFMEKKAKEKWDAVYECEMNSYKKVFEDFDE